MKRHSLLLLVDTSEKFPNTAWTAAIYSGLIRHCNDSRYGLVSSALQVASSDCPWSFETLLSSCRRVIRLRMIPVIPQERVPVRLHGIKNGDLRDHLIQDSTTEALISAEADLNPRGHPNHSQIQSEVRLQDQDQQHRLVQEDEEVPHDQSFAN